MKTTHPAPAHALLAALLFVFAASASASPADDDFAFLVRHMPAKDRRTVSEKYLRENTALAQEARRDAPWRNTITDGIFREYVLPYSSIGEDVDDWRPLFRRMFWPMVRQCRTTGEAVQIINSKIWRTLGVHYDTRRDKPDQSPFHSMRIHKASCTGLAILQIDAYRACGIPARFVGCNWTDIPGNHSWVEYYDAGSWHFFNDAEDGKIAPPDSAWFTAHAALADASSPRTRIYAARWSPGPARFHLPWDPSSAVPADDVTERYRRFRPAVLQSSVSFVARGPDGRRVPAPFRLVDPASGKVLAEGTTYDETHDMNDHFAISLPERTAALVQMKLPDGKFLTVDRLTFGAGKRLVTLKHTCARPAGT